MIYCSKQESSNCGLSQLEVPGQLPTLGSACPQQGYYQGDTWSTHRLSHKMGCQKSDSLIDA